MIEKSKSRSIRIEIRRTLMQEWDPIGVKDEPMASNEYDNYIGDIFELLERNASESNIYEYLLSIESERMGLTDQNGSPLLPLDQREQAANALKTLATLFDS